MNRSDSNTVSGQKHWLETYSLRVSSVFAIIAFWAICFLMISLTNIDSYLDAKIADPISFRVRDFLGKAPTQDSRLKVFAIDDKAFALLGTPMPGIDLWADIIDAIAEKKPRLILIDAMFSARADELNTRTKNIFRRIHDANVKIATGAFVSREELKFKTKLGLDADQYAIHSYVPGQETGKTNDINPDIHMPPWVSREGWFVYGPTENLADIFNNAGHFQLFEENKIDPFLWMGGAEIVPHLSMYTADQLAFRDQRLYINQRQVALSRDGSIAVNFIPRSKIVIRSMEQLIKDAKAGYAADKVNKGDVVVILPMYFTGNVDLRPSPYGWLPGGHYLIAMVNSILTGNWLQPILAGEILIVGLTVLAASAAYMFPASWFWSLWVFGVGAFFSVNQLIFSFAGFVIPYVLPILAGTVAGSHVFALKVRSYERKSMALRMALDGAISPSQMDNIIRRPDQVSLEPRERVLTLMFIDIVGFSLSSENMLPRMAFDNLKSILSQMTEIIHAHGGFVDKTLGDGLLCYFGYRLDSDETVADHPDKALRCAMHIQTRMLDDSLNAIKSGAPIYPLRIGINTASCYLGDIGSGKRIEFTVVGNGVNFAKRLESACDMFSVMISATTYELVKGASIRPDSVTRKMIKIKHHSELIDAFEFQPLIERRAEVDSVIDAYRKESSLKRMNERIPVNDPNSILVVTQFGPAEIMNFSGSGVSIIIKTTLARGTNVQLSFDSRVPGLSSALANQGLKIIESEVRWSYATTSGVVHGLMFTELSAEQQQIFTQLLTDFAFDTKIFGGGKEVDDDVVKAG